MKLTNPKGHLYRSLQAMSILPLFALGIIITFFSYHAVENAMHSQVQTELKNMANAIINMYDLVYPGDYHLEGTDSYEFMKGNQVITRDYSIIDDIKKDTRIDVTIFYQDTRILTTICNSEQERIVGTGVNSRIVEDVLLTGKAQFYNNATIYGVQYFSYYAPLRNSDGTVVGMIYTGKPCTEVDEMVWEAVYPIIVIALLSMLVVSLISSSYTQKLISAIHKIRNFFSKVSTGNLWEELDSEVLRRNDELSEMGYSALYMQRSLRNLVEQDTLTELNNRRYADKRLKQIQMRSNIHGTKFVVGIGDIDFFKSINDTYGHDCGDMVLKRMAAILKKGMAGKGFVARWGGEEFLFVYDDTNLTDAEKEVALLLEEIRNTTIHYFEDTIKVTMTFGLAEGGVNSNIPNLIQEADNKLYKGKESGRNCIVI